MRLSLKFQTLGILLILFMILNIILGSVNFTVMDFIEPSEQKKYILWNLRFPKMIMGLFSGAGLSLSGLYMQSVFRNPLAGPYVLGISSGASLGVALVILGAGILGISSYSIPLAAFSGAFLVMGVVSLASRWIKDSLSILIIGLMMGSFTSAIVALLSYFSEANSLKKYLIWGMGDLSSVPDYLLYFVILSTLIGLILGLKNLKGLNVFPMGEGAMMNLGLKPQKIRTELFIATCLMTGLITAAAGPIAFVGLSMPHIARLIFKTSDHKVLIPASAILGSICLLLCDLVASVPGSNLTLPINSITSLVGAPIVIYLMMKKNRLVL